MPQQFQFIDRNGQPYDVLMEQDPQSGTWIPISGLKDTAGVWINPATKEGLEALQLLLSAPLKVDMNKVVYSTSTKNSTSSAISLASGTTWNSATSSATVEDVFSTPSIQVMIPASAMTQAYTVTVRQYIDLNGTQLTASKSYTRNAGEGFNMNIQIPSNYFKIEVTNNGASAITGFYIQTTLGMLGVSTDGLTNYGNYPVGNYGEIGRLLSAETIEAEKSEAMSRMNQYGEFISAPAGQQQFALEDSYFVGGNPTIGTAVALNVAARSSFLATDPSIVIRNPNAAGGRDIIVKRINLICATVGATLTSLESAVLLGTGNNYTSGGTPLTLRSTRLQTAASALVYHSGAAAIVATNTSTITLSRCRIRTGAPVIGDTYKLNFGGEPTTETGALSGTVASLFAHSLPPLVIPPQGTAAIHLWGPGQATAPTYEFSLEIVER